MTGASINIPAGSSLGRSESTSTKSLSNNAALQLQLAYHSRFTPPWQWNTRKFTKEATNVLAQYEAKRPMYKLPTIRFVKILETKTIPDNIRTDISNPFRYLCSTVFCKSTVFQIMPRFEAVAHFATIASAEM